MKLGLWLFLCALAQAQNWPSFRGPGASGVAEGKVPQKWDAIKGINIVWKTEIPGLAHSSPVIWGDRVYITTAVSSDAKAVFRHGLYGDVDPSPDVSKHSWR
ncbi:MAG TPA: PQQ-binding-like beta-propeller repeat protein, partial [Bryobacteraceae bacterium]|nr:PQQ-binding-like beta-propeller repeat protein [Bryobacteraceae bacterium]